MKWFFFVLLFEILVVCSQRVWKQEVKLFPRDGKPSDNFGYSVDISAELVIVGTNSANGRAFIYNRIGGKWELQASLLNSAWPRHFGESVKISGNTSVVGSLSDGEQTRNGGAAFIFVKNAAVWTEGAKLFPENPRNELNFGDQVTIDENWIMVGSWVEDTVYFYQRLQETNTSSNWNLQEIIRNPLNDSESLFGHNVDISGKFALVAAVDFQNFTQIQGIVHVFQFNGTHWEMKNNLIPSIRDPTFGTYSLAIEGDYCIIAGEGVAHIYHYDGIQWNEQQIISQVSFKLGISVDISENYAVVGVPYEDCGGAVYIYQRNGTTWNQTARITPKDRKSKFSFGGSVAISGTTLVVGNTMDDKNGPSAGSCYIFVETDDFGEDFSKSGTI